MDIVYWLAGARSSAASLISSPSKRRKPNHKHRRQDPFVHVEYRSRNQIEPIVESTRRQQPGYPKRNPIVHQQRDPLTPPSTPSTRSEYSFISDTEETIMPNNDKSDRSRGNTTERETTGTRRGTRAERVRTNENITLDTLSYLDTPLQRMSWFEACCVLDRHGFNVTIDFDKLDPAELAALSDHGLFRSRSSPRSTTPRGGPEEALRALIPLRPKLEFKAPKAPPTTGPNLSDSSLSADACEGCGELFACDDDREAHYSQESTSCEQCKGSFECSGYMQRHACVSGSSSGSPRKHRKQNSAEMRSQLESLRGSY